MVKNKSARIIITLRCTKCKGNVNNINKPKGIFSTQIFNFQQSTKKIDYTTTKNRRNTPDRLELKKFCPNCNTHTMQKEIK